MKWIANIQQKIEFHYSIFIPSNSHSRLGDLIVQHFTDAVSQSTKYDVLFGLQFLSIRQASINQATLGSVGLAQYFL